MENLDEGKAYDAGYAQCKKDFAIVVDALELCIDAMNMQDMNTVYAQIALDNFNTK